MSNRESHSSIPRRITSSHFRPPPTPTDLASGTSTPGTPQALSSPLVVTRKRPRAESASTPTQQAPALRTFSLSVNEKSYAAKPDVPVAPAISLTQLLERPVDISGPINESAPSETQSATQSGWNIFSVAAGVVGKVWDFVDNKFQGFRAGGGTTYDLTPAASPLQAASNEEETSDEHLQPQSQRQVHPGRQFSWGAPNLPGFYPTDHHQHDWDSNKSTQPVDEDNHHAVKRRQTSQGGEWVLVSSETENTPPSASPTPRHASHSFLPRPSPRSATMRYRTQLSPRRTTSNASYTTGSSSNAKPRRTSLLPQTSKPLRPARSMSSFPSSAGSDHAGLSTPTDAGSSNTVRSPRVSAAHTLTTGDVARYRAKKEREERLQDASMRKLNEQMRAMIKEGKAALGSPLKEGKRWEEVEYE